jgi:REP element-mobilizing transposase RayT
MQTWFITSTTYGTWLPGDERGFVSNVMDEQGDWFLQNDPGTPYLANDAARKSLAQTVMKGPPVYLTLEQATAVASQFHETIEHRGWKLHVFAIMAGHVHIVITADDAVESSDILGDLKSYASRRLNREWNRPVSGTWWTESGSQRPIEDDAHFVNVVRYVANQPGCFVLWIDPELKYLLETPERGT